MSPASRRIFWYWLLLLVPTLIVGGVAIQLLRREQARLVAQDASAQEARREAVAARARLIVENVELLIGDVQVGLLDTLAEEPGESLTGFMAEWQKANPLVRVAFICRPNGELVYPAAGDMSEEARGFVRRFSGRLRSNPPWVAGAAKDEVTQPAVPSKEQLFDQSERKEISSNVSQVQSARRDVQQLAKSRDYKSVASAPAAAAPSLMGESDKTQAGAADAQKIAAEKLALNERARSEPAASSRAASRALPARNQKDSAVVAAISEQQPIVGVGVRRGWSAETVGGRLYLIGWVQPNSEAEVRGVEVELTAIVSRLAAALPVETPGGEGYALRDDQARVIHQTGAVATSGATTIRIPLATSMLPSWDVVAYISATPGSRVNGSGLFWASALLLGLFISAIVAGGSLLLRQARRSEEEAAQKTSFVANVSHEFKTPLTTIRLYSELLEQGRVRDEQQGGDYLRTIGRETERLARLVNNALDFSRLEQGQKKYARERIDLGFELNRMLETHTPRVVEAGLTMARRLPAEPLQAICDRDALEQIVLNLIDNACKYAAQGGEIVVSARSRAQGGAEVRVADRGPGVPPNQHERIFEKFHRVNDALTAEKTGAGLGLSIARQLARGLGGDLVYQPRDGGGAEFILIVP